MKIGQAVEGLENQERQSQKIEQKRFSTKLFSNYLFCWHFFFYATCHESMTFFPDILPLF